MRIRLIAGTLLLAATVSSAQELKRQTGTGVVSGRVINASTGRPISGAHVRLHTVNPPIGFGSTYLDVIAEATGSFSFTAVPAGTLELTATLDGYLEGRIGQRRPNGDGVWFRLADGEHFGAADILLWLSGRISGRVSDEFGKPLGGLTVHAWRLGVREWEGGRVSNAGSAETNSEGDYSIDALAPGSYVVALHATKTTVRARTLQFSKSSQSWFPDSIVPMVGISTGPLPVRPPGSLYVELPRGFPTPVRVEGRLARSYLSEFSPGGSVPDFDNPLRLSTGESRLGVDLVLRQGETTQVSGRLAGPHRTTSADVMLRHAGFPSDFSRSEGVEAATLMEPDGAFTMLEVPPGRYTLYERRFTSNGDSTGVVRGAWSDRPIEVTGLGVRDLEVQRPAVTTLRGRVVFQGKPSDTFQTESQVDVGVAAADPAESDRHRDGTETGGLFEIPDVVPGRYLISVVDALNRDRWWVESITLDGRDVTGQTIDVRSVDIAGFVVTVTATPTPLDGAVYGSNKHIADTAAVLVFPVDRASWPNKLTPRIQSTRAWKGKFRFEHLPPGEYYVTAMDDARMEGWPSGLFLEGIRGGATRITIKVGQPQVLSLPLK